MIRILSLLKKIESLAGLVYLKASEYFADDMGFNIFLRKLAEDEIEHGRLIENFGNKIADKNLPKLSITLDSEMHYRIEHDLSEINQMMADKVLTKDIMLKKMIDLEFSEWNDFFLSVISILKERDRHFVAEVDKFQNHRNFIEHYCRQFPDLNTKIQSLKEQPSVWTEKILIVDDEEIISDLLQKVLEGQGDIEVANNGQEGIQKVKNKYYKLIISDIDMPVMDGLTFFQTARKMFPNINERFLFFTADLTDDKRNFLKNNQLTYMLKPASLNEIKKNAATILTKH